MQIGLQIGRDIFVGRGREQTDLPAVQHLSQVESDHLGQRSIQVRREFVSDDPLRLLSDRQRQAKPVPLTIAEFGRCPQQQLCFTQSTSGEQGQSVGGLTRERIDEQMFSVRERVEMQHTGELSRGCSHETRFAGTRWPGEEGNIPFIDGEFQSSRDDVLSLLEADAEMIHHDRGPCGELLG